MENCNNNKAEWCCVCVCVCCCNARFLCGRYQTEFTEYKNYCGTRRRAVEKSGVSMAEVDERTRVHRNDTTDIFDEFRVHNRPSITPAARVNGAVLCGGLVDSGEAGEEHPTTPPTSPRQEQAPLPLRRSPRQHTNTPTRTQTNQHEPTPPTQTHEHTNTSANTQTPTATPTSTTTPTHTPSTAGGRISAAAGLRSSSGSGDNHKNRPAANGTGRRPPPKHSNTNADETTPRKPGGLMAELALVFAAERHVPMPHATCRMPHAASRLQGGRHRTAEPHGEAAQGRAAIGNGA